MPETLLEMEHDPAISPAPAEALPVIERDTSGMTTEALQHVPEQKKGMPQMDTSTYPSQLFWLTLCFVTMYLVLSRHVLPRIQDVLEGRQQRIDGDIEKAETLKRQSEDAREVYERALAESRSKAQAQLTEATEAAQKVAADKHSVLEKDLQKQLAEAEAEIATARRTAMNNINPAAADLASLIVEKLVHHKPSADTVKAVVNDIAKERVA